MPQIPRLYPYSSPPNRGDFGLTSGSRLAMKVIQIGTLSRYGHACVVVSDPDYYRNTIRIIEAQPGGARVRTVALDRFRWSNIVLTPEQRELIAARALLCEGLPYDWPAIFGFVARVLGHKLRLIGRKDHPDGKMICSELVVWAYLAADIDLGQGKPPGDVSPGDLADYLVQH